jgi:hypothetical protein
MEIRIGDTVLWRGAFGQALERKAKVIGIERSGLQRDKYGVAVESIPYELKEYGVFDLDNGCWCYGEQIVEKVSEQVD